MTSAVLYTSGTSAQTFTWTIQNTNSQGIDYYFFQAISVKP
jgi:hypothetical protein